jgi:hypothetical protein
MCSTPLSLEIRWAISDRLVSLSNGVRDDGAPCMCFAVSRERKWELVSAFQKSIRQADKAMALRLISAMDGTPGDSQKSAEEEETKTQSNDVLENLWRNEVFHDRGDWQGQARADHHHGDHSSLRGWIHFRRPFSSRPFFLQFGGGPYMLHQFRHLSGQGAARDIPK